VRREACAGLILIRDPHPGQATRSVARAGAHKIQESHVGKDGPGSCSLRGPDDSAPVPLLLRGEHEGSLLAMMPGTASGKVTVRSRSTAAKATDVIHPE